VALVSAFVTFVVKVFEKPTTKDTKDNTKGTKEAQPGRLCHTVLLTPDP